jgi:hypothetical protein
MLLTTYQGEKDLPSLLDRLYQFRRPSAAVQAAARAALLTANPHLRDLEQVPVGFVIVVPEIPRLKIADDIVHITDAVDEMLGEVHRAMGVIRAAASASFSHEVEEAKTTTELLRHVEALGHADPLLAERLRRMAEEARARVEEAKALQAEQEQALKQLEKELQDFSKRPSHR